MLTLLGEDSSISRLIKLLEEVESYSVGTQTLNLKTKYYDINIPLLRALDENSEAVIIIDSASIDKSNYSKLLEKHEQLMVRLYVKIVDTVENDLDISEDMSDLEWCIDHEMELITINSSNLYETWNEREKEGIARLIEALQSNMWSNININTTKKDNNNNISKESIFNQIELNEVSLSSPSIEEPIVPVEPVPVIFPDDKTSSEKVDEINNNLNNIKATMDNLDLGGDLHRFVDMARQVREEAMTGNLSDNERRMKAAEVAQRMMEFMALEDDDDEDDDEDDANDNGDV